MLRIINLHHPLEPVWDGFARDRFERHFDEYFSRPLTSATDTIVVDWVGKVVNGGDDPVVVFISHPELCPWLALKKKLAGCAPSHKIFGFLGECHGAAETEWEAIADVFMEKIFDGLFVASAWHKYMLIQQGWSDDKIHLAGYPVDTAKAAKGDLDKRVVCVPDAKENLDFVLDVIEFMGMAVIDNDETIIFDLSLPELPKRVEDHARKVLQDMRITRLKKELPEGITIRIIPSPDGSSSLMPTARVSLACSPRAGFNPILASLIMSGSHPVVPQAGCYMEMVRMDLSEDRYAYTPGDIASCASALLKGLRDPSPPKKYIEAYVTAFDQMAEVIIGE